MGALRLWPGRSLLFYTDLNSFPNRAAGYVGDLDALRLQLIPDPVGLGKIFGLLGTAPGQHQGVDLRIALSGDGVSAGGLGGLGPGLLLPDLVRLGQQVQGQHLIKAVQDGQLGGSVGLVTAMEVFRSLPT